MSVAVGEIAMVLNHPTNAINGGIHARVLVDGNERACGGDPFEF